jgi:hypothetical protein
MAACTFCKAETELYDSGVPICVKCSEARGNKRKPPTLEHRVLNILQQDLQAATERCKAATVSFDAVTSDIPSGIPNSDGTQRIRNASREATVARMGMLRAHHRLNDFLNAGVVPDDLKRVGRAGASRMTRRIAMPS